MVSTVEPERHCRGEHFRICLPPPNLNFDHSEEIKSDHATNEEQHSESQKDLWQFAVSPFAVRVPMVGLEPTRLLGHWILNPARLPVPPHRLENLRRDIMSGERSRVKRHRCHLTTFPLNRPIQIAKSVLRPSNRSTRSCDKSIDFTKPPPALSLGLISQYADHIPRCRHRPARFGSFGSTGVVQRLQPIVVYPCE